MAKRTEEDLIERVKHTLFLKGRNSSETINDVLRDMSLLSKPYNKNFSKKNEITPFEDCTPLEFLAPKNDCGLFVMGTHSKKRPNNLIIGRIYDDHLLDMYEFGVEEFQSMESFPGQTKSFGSKPLLIFLGSQWEFDATYQRVQNLLLDLFRGFKPEEIMLQGVDHVITCAVNEGTIYIRPYYVHYQRSGDEVPNLSLQPMGPFLDLSLRRHQPAADDLWKLACKRPKILKEAKVKNVEKNVLGDKIGRIHMKKQNLDALAGRKMKALRGKKRGMSEENGNEGPSDSKRRKNSNNGEEN
jgi:ribosome production factor 2